VMFRRKRVLAALGILFFAVFVFLIWPRTRKPPVTFDLADGTSIKFIAVTHGKILRFYHGQFWQKALFALSRGKIPPRFGGYEIVFPTIKTNDNVGLELRHFRKNGVFTVPINGSQRLVQMGASGKEVVGNQRVVNFDTSTGLIFNQPGSEDIYWEFPLSGEREIHLRLYVTNTVDRTVSTNDFSVPNPAYK
jgi:hypothetical protein